MPDKPRFGPAGIPSWFKELKAPVNELPRLLQKEGLSALEYEAVRWGQKPQINQEEAERLGVNAEKHDIWLTIHASLWGKACPSDEDSAFSSYGSCRLILERKRGLYWEKVLEYGDSVNARPGEECDYYSEDPSEYIFLTSNDLPATFQLSIDTAGDISYTGPGVSRPGSAYAETRVVVTIFASPYGP